MSQTGLYHPTTDSATWLVATSIEIHIEPMNWKTKKD